MQNVLKINQLLDIHSTNKIRSSMSLLHFFILITVLKYLENLFRKINR